MRIRIWLGICVLCTVGTVANAEEIGPAELRGKTAEVRTNADRVRAAILADARMRILRDGEARMESLAAFSEIVRRLVPGGAGLPALARLPRIGDLDEPEREAVRRYAKDLARSAERLRESGLGAAAGYQAYLSWRMDPACREAAAILGYVEHEGEFVHPRRQALSEKGPGRPALEYAFVRIVTKLPPDEVAAWAVRMDPFLEWVRARFAGVPGYEEPEWPLEVRIYRTPEEAQENGDRPPAPFAYWRKHGVVNAAAFKPGTMPMENVVQHELAHGFLEAAFPTDPEGAVYSGWMTEAFPQWIYAVSAESPNEPRFWWVAEAWLGPVLEELRDGKDVLGKLRRMNYAEGRTSRLAAVGGILADWCAGDALRWEGFARFTANYVSYRERYPDFERLLGSPELISRELAAWARTRTARFDWGKPAGTENPGTPARDGELTFQGRTVDEWATRIMAPGAGGLSELTAAGEDALPMLLALGEWRGNEGRWHHVPLFALLSARKFERAAPAIRQIFERSAAESKWGAACALCYLGVSSPEVVTAMLEALDQGGHSYKAHVFTAFRSKPVPRPEVLEKMAEFLSDGSEDYRIRSSWVLAAMGDAARPGGVDALRERLAVEESATVRPSLAFALWKLGGSVEETLPVVIAELAPDRPRPDYAAGIAGRFEAAGAPAAPRLVELTKHASWGVRSSAASALGRIEVRTEEVIAALRALSDDDQPRVRDAAARALRALGK